MKKSIGESSHPFKLLGINIYVKTIKQVVVEAIRSVLKKRENSL